MKAIFLVGIWSIIIYGCNTMPGNTTKSKAADNTTRKKPILKQYFLTGKATNITFKESCGVEVEITETEDKKYKCRCQFDNKTLFGSAEMDGGEFKDPNSPGVLSFQFTGRLELGDNDGSGYPPGTKRGFSSIFNLFAKNAIGKYVIDVLPDNGWVKEIGLYDLQIITRYNRPPGAFDTVKKINKSAGQSFLSSQGRHSKVK